MKYPTSLLQFLKALAILSMPLPYGALHASTVELSSPTLQLSPIAYWDFESSPASLPLDLSNGNARLEYQSNDDSYPTVITGAKGNAWDFTSTTAVTRIRGARLDGIGDISADRGFSISIWIKHNHSGTYSRVGGSGYGEQWELIILDDGELAFSFGEHTINIPASSDLDDGNWHHIVGSVDFNHVANNANIYLDGTLVSQDTVTFSKSFFSLRTDQPIYIGASARGIGTDRPFSGSIDELALFNYPLDQDAVNLLKDHNAQAVTVTVPNLELGATIVRSMDQTSFSMSPSLSNVDVNDPDVSLTWSVSGNRSEVSFSDIHALNPTVTFTPNEEYDYFHIHLQVEADGVVVRDSVTVSFSEIETPTTRTLSSVPAAGVHPRILFTSADLPAMRTNYNSSSPAQSGAIYIQNSIATAQATNSAFQAVLAGNLSYDLSSASSREGLTRLILNGASVALMEDDTDELNEMATALSTYGQLFLPHYVTNYDNPLVADADMELALAYDILYNNMDEAGRTAVRTLLARMSKYRKSYGCFLELKGQASNWILFHDNVVICALAIEGEDGYDPFVFESNVRKLRHFFTEYGVHENGFAHEGDGYLNFGLERGALSLLATAHRDENFFQTSRFYKNTVAKLREIQPWADGVMYSHHDGQTWGNGFFLGHAYWITSHMYPTDAITSHVTTRFANSANESRKRLYGCVLFSRPPLPNTSSAQVVAEAANLPLAVFETERGLVNARSDWSEDAIRLDFECRMDTYGLGHLHSDRNMFTLGALGRQWITDQGYHETANDMHATVLIDGIGQPVSALNRWMAMPGRFIDYSDNGTYVVCAGDAKPAYSYHLGATSNDPNDGVDDPNIPNSIESILDTPSNETFTWADFVYANTPPEDIPAWKHNDALENVSYYNPVERAFRTAMMKRGENPYVLIVDDIQKDSDTHIYEWLAPVSSGTQLNPGNVIVESSTDTQAILRFASDSGAGTPRLLVRVIEAKGTVVDPIQIVTRNIGIYSQENGQPASPYDLLVIRRETVAPDFKVLLYPFLEGDPLPTTSIDGSHIQIITELGGLDEISCNKDATGRTVLYVNSTPPAFAATPSSADSVAIEGEIMSPAAHSFTITNQLNGTLDWTASVDQSWLQIDTNSGSIAKNGQATITASLQASVNTLGIGVHTATLTVQQNGEDFHLAIPIRVEWKPVPPDSVPTEVFSSSNTFDLNNTQLTFVPLDNSYRVYITTGITELPTPLDAAEAIQGNPTTNSSWGGRDDGYWTRTPAWTNAPIINGSAIGDIHICTNGFISFDPSVYYSYSQVGATNHLSNRQISAFWKDLNGTSGDYHYEFIAGAKAVVTFENIPQYGASSTKNTAQIELFDDGSGIIRITYLSVDTSSPVVGVSSGTGTPEGWPDNMANFSDQAPLPLDFWEPTITLVPVDTTTSESGNDSASFKIVRVGALDTSLTLDISLSGTATTADYSGSLVDGDKALASDLSELDVELQAIDDGLAEGPETLNVTLNDADGYKVGTSTSITLSFEDTPYDGWRHTHQQTTAEQEDDADGDGIPTLIEYALGTDPNSGQSEGYAWEVDTDTNIVTITLDQPIPDSVNLSARWSENLSTWHAEGVSLEGQTIRITGLTGDRVFIKLVAE